MISRYVLTVEQFDSPDRGWSVHLIGPDRRPVTMAGTELEWPLNAAVEHIKAQMQRPSGPVSVGRWERLPIPGPVVDVP